MLNRIGHIFLLLMFFFTLTSNLFAQGNKKESLQKKYNTILKDIKGIESLISETETKKKESLNQLQSLSAKIGSRETLILNINEQIIVIDDNILEQKGKTKAMTKDIENLKKDYAKMIYHSYKNIGTTSKISFLLSSETFNQAMRRFNYLKSYAKNREKQALLIKETISSIESKVTRLEKEKLEKEKLLLEEEHQKTVLVTEKQQKDVLIIKLKDDSDNLKTQISKKNNSALTLNNQIQKMIQKEIKLAEAKAIKRAESNSPEAAEYVSKEIKLSKEFANNKGKLPWPVDKGHIVEHFGKNAHPNLPKITINNNGVDIRTDKDQKVKTIFSGVVVNSFYLPTTQNSIIIKHGEYFTVYSNLETISVNLGDQVKTGQVVGKAYTSADKITKVHLEIWKSITKLNPEYWIKKMI